MNLKNNKLNQQKLQICTIKVTLKSTGLKRGKIYMTVWLDEPNSSSLINGTRGKLCSSAIPSHRMHLYPESKGKKKKKITVG